MVTRPKTILDFNYKGNILPIVEKWAYETNFTIKITENGMIECQRGISSMMCPIFVQINQSEENVHLQIWLKIDILTELTSFFTAPPESGIESDIDGLNQERDLARHFINKLLTRLGQPAIQ